MLYALVTGQPGHPDQFPYIDSCLLIVQNSPPWGRVCYLEKGESKILLVQAEPRQEKLKKKKKKIMIQRKRSPHFLPHTGEHDRDSQRRRKK